MLTSFRALRTVALLAVAVVLVGCERQSQKPADAATPPASHAHHGDTDHAHKPSAHGGIIVGIGRDNYHAEAVFETGGTLLLYTLGQDESKVLEVEAEPLNAYVKPEGEIEATAFVLKPEPQSGDAAGKTSRFVGKLPREVWGKSVEVTVPSIRIGGERFRVGFKSTATAHGEAMPPKVADEAERKLYLTAGGKYTEADIRANGNVTPSERFKGLKAEHDLKPKAGDKVCPITDTKANPKFSWVVGGKTYEFCCPPCVDEFVQTAKDKPTEVKDPEEYRKK
jgi:YHS domain-containing protein